MLEHLSSGSDYARALAYLKSLAPAGKDRRAAPRKAQPKVRAARRSR
jgi:hypothetical protein